MRKRGGGTLQRTQQRSIWFFLLGSQSSKMTRFLRTNIRHRGGGGKKGQDPGSGSLTHPDHSCTRWRGKRSKQPKARVVHFRYGCFSSVLLETCKFRTLSTQLWKGAGAKSSHSVTERWYQGSGPFEEGGAPAGSPCWVNFRGCSSAVLLLPRKQALGLETLIQKLLVSSRILFPDFQHLDKLMARPPCKTPLRTMPGKKRIYITIFIIPW